jgi:hypothetical protein
MKRPAGAAASGVILVGKVSGIGVLALVQAALMVAVFLGLGAAVGSSLVHGAAPGIVITGAVFLVLGYAVDPAYRLPRPAA